jgi:hypothetical protein
MERRGKVKLGNMKEAISNCEMQISECGSGQPLFGRVIDHLHSRGSRPRFLPKARRRLP